MLALKQRSTALRQTLFCSVILVSACGTTHGLDGGRDGAVDSGSDLDGLVPPGDAAPEDGGEDWGPAFLAFCIRLGELLCTGMVACCTDPEPERSLCNPPDQRRARCEELAADPALRDGTLRWRAADAARHVAELEASLEACGAIDRLWSYGDVLEGTLGEGEDCTPLQPELQSLGTYRCREGLRCELTGTVTDYAGRCAPPGGVGDSCDRDCADGLFCRHTPDLEPFWGYCDLIVTGGGACRHDYGCSTTYCVGFCIEVEPADTWCGVSG